MSHANPEALEFLRTRRSHSPKLLQGPAPSREELTALMEIASRVPDHGKLEPWRFVVLERAALDRLAPLLADFMARTGAEEKKIEKARNALKSPVVVAVVSSAKPDAKVPEWEQFLSAGLVAFQLVNAALAAGYGAAWLTGPATTDEFSQSCLGVSPGERVVALVHIGQSGPTPVERPRPVITEKITWLD